MNPQIEIPPQILTDAIAQSAQSLFQGELGDKVAANLANLYAEVTTYNRTDSAKLLNVARNTLYKYEEQGLIKFRADDGRASLSALLELQRKLGEIKSEESDGGGNEPVNRKEQKPRRRVLKN
jgi:DNA topoisomerase IA